MATYGGFICAVCRILWRDMFRVRLTHTKMFLINIAVTGIAPRREIQYASGLVALHYFMLLSLRIIRFHPIYFSKL